MSAQLMPDIAGDLAESGYARLCGVGLDVGSVRSRVVFSDLTVAMVDPAQRPVGLAITYESPVLRTPYLSATAIDMDALVAFVDAQFAAAGVAKEDIGCAVAVLSGKAREPENARLGAELSARFAGRFVTVNAGEALKTVLAAHGSGAAARSAVPPAPVLNIQVGSRTTRLALCERGSVTATAMVDVGYRSVVVDEHDRVLRLSRAARRIADRLDLRLALGVRLQRASREAIAAQMVDEVMAAAGLIGEPGTGPSGHLDPASPSRSVQARALALPSPAAGCAVVVSGSLVASRPGLGGGVGGEDLSSMLGAALRAALRSVPGITVMPAAAASRAAALGATQVTVRLPADAVHPSRPDVLPLYDVPIAVVSAVAMDPAETTARVRGAAARVGVSAEGALALAIRWSGVLPPGRSGTTAAAVVDGIEAADTGGPLVLVCDQDAGALIGHQVATLLPDRAVVLLEGVDVRDLDIVDIGAPLDSSGTVPVTVKSLVLPPVPDAAEPFSGPAPVDGAEPIEGTELIGRAESVDETELVGEPEVDPPDTGLPLAHGTFSSLRVYNYRLYFFGQGISMAGTWMQNIAVAWLVLQLTNSAVILGAVTAARFVPLVLLGPWGGLLADRSDKLRLLTATQAVLGSLAMLLAILSWLHLASLPAVLAIVLGLGLVNVLDNPTRQALIPNLVGREQLANAVALNSVALNSSRILGPGVGGALIATLGVAPCFFINALSFGAVIFSLTSMRRSELVVSQRAARAKGQIRAGLRYVARTPTILAPLVMTAVVGVFAWEFPVSLPLVTRQTFHAGATAYGLVTSCLGAGSIVGGLFAARRRRHSIRSLALSAVVWGILILLAAGAPTLPVLFGALALVGSGAITFNSANKTLIQLSSDPVMRGRVMALWSIGWQGSTVVGAPIIGFVSQQFGARYGLAIGGVATTLIGGYYVLRWRSRHIGSPPAPRAGEARSCMRQS